MLEEDKKESTVIEARKSKGKTVKRLVIALLIVFVLITAGLAAGGYYFLNMIRQVPLTEGPGPGSETADSESTPPLEVQNEPGQSAKPSPVPTPSQPPKIVNREDLLIPEDSLTPDETGIINILLLGLDRRSDNEGARSDSMMIASIDKKENRVKLTSLMRDMYVTIPGREDNRINTGFIFGGPALAIKTVNKNFDMNIEHYIAVDFKGFEKIIDNLGGVEITVTQGEADIIGLESAGKYVLNGEEALIYSRIRKIGADYERTDRQRLVLNTLFNRAKSVSIWKIPEMLVNILPNIETNLTKSQMLALGKNILESAKNPLEDNRLPLAGTFQSRTIRKMAVLVPDLEKNKQVLHEFIYGDRSKYKDKK